MKTRHLEHSKDTKITSIRVWENLQMCIQIWNQKVQHDEFADVMMTSVRRTLLGRWVNPVALEGASCLRKHAKGYK